MSVDYVLPLKWSTAADPADVDELAAYLRRLRPHVRRLIVVDGSAPAAFRRHSAAFGPDVEHVPPDPIGFTNGKVDGVHTGLRLATADHVVVADDDVRYDEQSLRATIAHLEHVDLVGPQNVFAPTPWHALWDTARTLLNRAVAADYPGTFALRRDVFRSMGGYDGDVLFENLELMRTVRAAGGRVARPLDVYVVRRPGTAERFGDQRVRQAYDDLAQPWRLATSLAVLPAAAVVVARRRGPWPLAAAALGLVALAEVGRRRAGGRAHFPALASWFAPVWVTERAVCSWVAVGRRLRGGVPYAGSRLRVAAHSTRTIRRRLRAAARRAEPGADVRPVAQRLQRGAAAAAQRDGARLADSIHAADTVDTNNTVDTVEPVDAHRPPDEQRPVPVGRDVGGHPGALAPRPAAQTDVA